MKRLALVLVLLLAAPAARADDPPPAWMPSAPRGPTRGDEEQARKLKREATALGTIGLVLAAGGIAVLVVSLDVPQSERTIMAADGTRTVKRVLGDANYAELAGGIALTVTGVALAGVALLKSRQARKLLSNE